MFVYRKVFQWNNQNHEKPIKRLRMGQEEKQKLSVTNLYDVMRTSYLTIKNASIKWCRKNQ